MLSFIIMSEHNTDKQTVVKSNELRVISMALPARRPSHGEAHWSRLHHALMLLENTAASVTRRLLIVQQFLHGCPEDKKYAQKEICTHLPQHRCLYHV